MTILSRMTWVGPWVLILSLWVMSPLGAQTGEPAPAADSPVVAVEAFSDALAAGDEAAVRALLAADVLIYESGGAERSLEEYAGHHMGSDMAFVGAMDNQLTERRVFDGGDFAVVTSMSRSRGSFREREIDSLSTETMVLEKHGGAWLIKHIHWSSRPAPQ